jgi:aspartate/methionine/tyrosine aminotransferase
MKAFKVSSLVQAALAPPILEARSWLGKYNGSKGAPIDLSQAAPPYSPSTELLERIGNAAKNPELAKYGPVSGEHVLRDAYAHYSSDLYGTALTRENVSVTAGANQAFVIASMIVAQAGDAVILPAPWYFNHKMTLDMLGIDTRVLKCLPANNFIPDVSDLVEAIDDKVRALVLVTPNNPTGSYYPAELINAYASICYERGIWLIIDETYRDFLPDVFKQRHTAFSLERRRGVIGIYSFSKSLALPGHRLGAIIYPAEIADQVVKVQDCLQICPVRAGQLGVAWALVGMKDWRRSKRDQFIDNARSFSAAMHNIPGWTVESIGAYFAYVRHPFISRSAFDVAQRLAEENGLLSIPGTFFGPEQEHYLRVSFGNLRPETLAELPLRFKL